MFLGGKWKKLRVGALPTEHMPQKSCLRKKTKKRPPPKERLPPAIHIVYKSFKSILSAHIPPGWVKTTTDVDDCLKIQYQAEHDQPKFAVMVKTNFSMRASYYGWGASHACYLNGINVSTLSLSDLLNKIQSSFVCSGTSADCATAHVITKPCDLNSDIMIPTSTTLTKR